MRLQSRILALVTGAALASACAVEDDLDDVAEVGVALSSERCWLLPDGSLNAGCLPVRTEEEWRIFMASTDRTRVRSMSDWARCANDSRCNPLRGIEPAVAERFTRSLVFRNGGLAGADFSELVHRFTFQQFATLWNAFGMDPWFTDWVGYACVGAGDCEVESTHICTSNC